MKRLHIRPEAELDIIEAAVWYENERANLGFEFEAELGSIYQRIVEQPRQFPVQGLEVRRALFTRFPYGVFFKEREEEIVIIGVFHHHRAPEARQRR
ncbi:MAG TPA: type II toxin-antitoxin system RelE/ParE family toxin [Polyangiales bacterium]